MNIYENFQKNTEPTSVEKNDVLKLVHDQKNIKLFQSIIFKYLCTDNKHPENYI